MSIDLSVERFQKPTGQFEGRIDADEIQPDGKFGPQYYIAVTPQNPERETLRVWVKIPQDKNGVTRMSGQLAETFEPLAAVFSGQITGIGKGELVGKSAIFEFAPSFYTDPRTKTEMQRTRDTLVAVAPVEAKAPAGKK